MKSNNAGRMINIELLRNIAMLEIVFIHMIGKSGMLENLNSSQPMYYFMWIVYAFVLTGNNIFMLIIGYFMCESRFRLSKVLSFYITVLSYSVLVAIFAKYILNAELLGGWRTSVFPIVNRSYWFATVYLAVLIISPFINIFISSLDRIKYKSFLLIGGVLFSLISSFFPDCLESGGGYGLTYFAYIYMVGAYIRKYMSQHHKLIGTKYLICISILPIICFLMKDNETLQGQVVDLMYKHCFPLIVLASVYLFVLFLKINISNDKIKKVIYYFSSSTFAVYLIHNNINISHYLWDKTGVQIWAVDKQNPFMVLVIGILVFVLCIIIDKLRMVIFKLLRIDMGITHISNMIENRFHIDEKMNATLSETKTH